ncbi:hypothetical protein D9611_006528 [Ephemerocybe angulata]|uniref:Uncharacterized protein n=1 Tax=Ephemerocybe angulata TaxID=980116 RepID=A0A8H5C9C0_9AGAR|nr:hypothetical protein D9611_006528 [Tulosesus angulatus]
MGPFTTSTIDRYPSDAHDSYGDLDLEHIDVAQAESRNEAAEHANYLEHLEHAHATNIFDDFYKNLSPPWPVDCIDDQDSSLEPADPSSRSPSPAVTFSHFGACTCEACSENAASSTFYPPEVRAQKLEAYEKWRQKEIKDILEAKKRRIEKCITYLELRRARSMIVVADMLELTEAEMGDWDVSSMGDWREKHEAEAERWMTHE